MGQSVDAELIFGIDIIAYDDDYERTPLYLSLYDEAKDDWRDFEEEAAIAAGAVNPWDLLPDEINTGTTAQFEEWKLANPEWEKIKQAWNKAKDDVVLDNPFEFRHYGHYDDPDGPRAILSPKGSATVSGSAWSPAEVNVADLQTLSDAEIDRLNAAARRLGIKADFGDARWLLVASYG